MVTGSRGFWVSAGSVDSPHSGTEVTCRCSATLTAALEMCGIVGGGARYGEGGYLGLVDASLRTLSPLLAMVLQARSGPPRH